MTKTILITGARAPVALHFARLLASAGHKIILADTQYFPMSRGSRFVHNYVRVPRPTKGLSAFGQAIERIVSNENCDFILPTCEEIFYLAAWRDLHGRHIPLLAPEFEKLATVHNKYSFAELVKKFSINASKTILFLSQSDVTNFSDNPESYVFKPVWSRFASDVLMCPKRENLNALAITESQPWIAQKYLPGEELCCWAWASQGKVRAVSSYRPLLRVGLGASISFEPIIETEIERFVGEFCTQMKWSGQVSFDFRRDAEGKLHVLECNPRATSGVHFFGPESQLAGVIVSEAKATPDVQSAMTLPLAMLVYGLPQAIRTKGLAGFHHWIKQAKSTQDITAWPHDKSMLPMQILSLLEITALAIRLGVDLKSAATSDIEWNGNDLSPMP